MSPPWTLKLDPASPTTTTLVGGLPTALRLALDAQRAGADGVAVAPSDVATRTALEDDRLALPVVAEPVTDRVVRVAANTVVHRDALRLLVSGQAATLSDASTGPPYGFPPIGVVDTQSARLAEKRLFRALRKPQDGWTSRWLNRYISLTISRWLVKTPLRPNQVSIGILGIGLLGAWFASRGHYEDLLAGAALFQAQSVLDGCDGEMSRMTYRGSLLGEWLDTIGDDVTNYGFFGAAGWGLYTQTGLSLYWVAALVTVVCGITASAIEYRYLIGIGSGDLLKYPLSVKPETTHWSSRITPLFKRDTFVFLTLVAAVIGAVGPMLVVFALGAIGILSGVIGAELRMRAERRS